MAFVLPSTGDTPHGNCARNNSECKQGAKAETRAALPIFGLLNRLVSRFNTALSVLRNAGF
jgi:hypothetical protein